MKMKNEAERNTKCGGVPGGLGLAVHHMDAAHLNKRSTERQVLRLFATRPQTTCQRSGLRHLHIRPPTKASQDVDRSVPAA